MDNEVRKTTAMTLDRRGDEELTSEFRRVRNFLLSLPRVCCPAGFEFRLQHRVDELERGVRPIRERRGWGWGWAGLGLGLATALLVAVVMFDFSFNSRDIITPGTPVTSSTEVSKSVTPPTTNPVMASSPQQVSPTGLTSTPEQAGQLASSTDSNAAKKEPTSLPENLYHSVSGNSP